MKTALFHALGAGAALLLIAGSGPGVSDKSLIFAFGLDETGPSPPILDFMGIPWGREQ